MARGIDGSAVRLNGGTPSNAEVWENVEITDYAKVIESISPSSTANGNKAEDKGNGEEEVKDSRVILTGEEREEDTIINIHAKVQHT
jgi:hypothetical protein